VHLHQVPSDRASETEPAARAWSTSRPAGSDRRAQRTAVSNDVSVVDTVRRAVVATIAAGDGPWGVAMGH
jgi:YVTN family beta-propeller protein